MAFFTGLLSITLFVWLFSLIIKKGPFQKFWNAARLATVLMFLQVGIMHIVNPLAFIYMIEGMLPYPKTMVVISGLTEIVLALGLLWRKSRSIAAGLLILQLIAMFPANINVAINSLPAPGGLPSEDWYVWSRLLFQPIYIYWIYKSALFRNKDKLKSNQPVKTEKATISTIPNIHISENHSKTLSK